MKTLTALSKFTGHYRLWQDTINRYNLKWSSGDSLQIFHDIVNEKTSLSTMIDWVKEAISKLPEPYYNIIIYNTLTGLRPSEVCVSISLIQQQDCFRIYYNNEKSMLEHFKFPELFIRRTKKAYISIVNDLVLNIARKAYEKRSYNALKLVLRRRKVDAHLYYSRKIFATYLRNQGIEPEIIDLLQGRTPRSIFSRHYYKPDLVNQMKVKACIDSLYRSIF
jgi:intergrase/recombinase